MEGWELVGIAIGLGMDVLSVSMAVAAGPALPRQAFRLSWHFGLFQFLMPLLGWAIGRSVVDYVAAFDHWVAFGLLVAIGGHMLLDGFRNREERAESDRSKGWSLVALSIATSIDALGVGLTLGVTQQDRGILFPALVIGVMSSVMSLVGIACSRRLKAHFGRHMEKVGGIILIAMGVRFLLGG